MFTTTRSSPPPVDDACKRSRVICLHVRGDFQVKHVDERVACVDGDRLTA